MIWAAVLLLLAAEVAGQQPDDDRGSNQEAPSSAPPPNATVALGTSAPSTGAPPPPPTAGPPAAPGGPVYLENRVLKNADRARYSDSSISVGWIVFGCIAGGLVVFSTAISLFWYAKGKLAPTVPGESRRTGSFLKRGASRSVSSVNQPFAHEDSCHV
ncbi:hypothetical protein DIPPA_20828 [Diplonema papillatum]|nr:hypothetical protein DIPPA_20828 [Diplonema papillatum]